MSPLMRAFVAGQLKYARDITYFLAPYINSYKRFQVGTFAPTKTVWSRDNRTAGFRLCGEGSQGDPHRMPHRRRRPQSLSGLRGADRGGPCRASRRSSTLEAPFSGDAYFGKTLPEVPKTLREATECLDKSKMLREAFGDAVVEHYVHTAQVGAVRIRPPHHRLGADARV